MAYRVGDRATASRPRGGQQLARHPSRLVRAAAISTPVRSPANSNAIVDYPEIDCLRRWLPADLAERAERRATAVGISVDHVLVAHGLIAEETYVAELGNALGAAFEPLDDTTRETCPIDDQRLLEAAMTGLLPLRNGDGLDIVVAPLIADSRRLVKAANSGSVLAKRIRLTTRARLLGFIERHGTAEIGRRAVDELRQRHPTLSAKLSAWRSLSLLTAAAALAVLGAVLAPDMAASALEFGLGTIFLMWTGLRLAGILSRHATSQKPEPYADHLLPVYTVVIALYREADAVRDLIASLRRINYPIEKLDIKFVLESDDDETRAALLAMRSTLPFEIITAPAIGPRTKPKALNVALPFARGAFVAVYDAEDRPDPDQLRLAHEAFVAADRKLACVQARLTIDNSADSWLARVFTAEYAGLFDVLLPSLSGWHLPLPLGGSSNHFRTATLREVGAWDPYNVTEDADLGMRLARFGYRAKVIASTTYEEAPAQIGLWLKQRTRWCKGWVQTWLVHMRSPRRLYRELGPKGFTVFQLLVGGTVLASVVHVLFLLQLLLQLLVVAFGDQPSIDRLGFHIGFLVCGYLASAALGLFGLARRGLLRCAWALLLIPVYWILLSVAAWRALIQLAYDPYRWEKTTHGLARTSRLTPLAPSLLRNIVVDRRRRRPPSALH